MFVCTAHSLPIKIFEQTCDGQHEPLPSLFLYPVSGLVSNRASTLAKRLTARGVKYFIYLVSHP